MADLVKPRSGSGQSTPGVQLRRIRVQRAQTTAVAWLAHAQLNLEEWKVYGSRIGRMSKSTNWWLGDWVRFGQRRFDLRYAKAAEISGYDEQTLMNLAYVSGRFPTSRRRETLSWSHHAELAKLEPGDQERWLDRAIRDALSVRKLRTELRAEERAKAQAELDSTAPAGVATAATATSAGTVRCPHCGAMFFLEG